MKKNRELYQALELAGLVPLLAWRKKCFWLAFSCCWRGELAGYFRYFRQKRKGQQRYPRKKKRGEDPWD